MSTTALRIFRLRKIRWLYLAGFVAYLHLNFILYVNSNFIGDIVGERYVGAIYVLAACFSLVTFVGAARVLRQIGNYKALVIFAALEMAILLGLATINNVFILIFLDILLLSLEPAIFFSLDIFLENYSHPEHGETDGTGGVRGAYLGIANLAFVIAPFIMGAIVGVEEHFRSVYFVSVLLLIPLLAIVALKFRTFVDPRYHALNTHELFRSLKTLAYNKDLLGVFSAQFILRLFYAISVVYLPIYLHTHLGFSWPLLGAILAITQIPYVIFEIPLGRIADRVLGEQELMLVGFLILAAGIALISYTQTTSILFWTSVIYLANVGGAIVEVSTESYFFKKVDGRSAHSISLFRMIQPSATLVGVFVGSALLFVMPLRYLFVVFGAITLLGMLFGAMIKDTR